jgi:hypothetical protein
MEHLITQRGDMSEPGGESHDMNCEDVRDLLYLFLTNELEEGESQQVCTHLLECGSCREAMAEHVKLSGALKRSIPGIQLRYYSRNN